MDRGSTEVEIHCACAWERIRVAYLAGTFNPIYEWRQSAWCRLHMEAEIAKQGQAAGAVEKTANPNEDVAQTGKPDGMRGLE